MKGYRDNVYLFQADWHVDQRQYDAGDPSFRRALAESAAGQEHVLASQGRSSIVRASGRSTKYSS